MSFCLLLLTSINVELVKNATVAQIEQAGGEVFFKYQENPRHPGTFTEREPPTPVWIQELFGKNCFQQPVAIFDSGSQVHLSKLKFLPRLDTVAVYDRDLNDDEVSAIAQLPLLRNLELFRVPITDKRLSCFQDASEIWQINIINSKAFTGTGTGKLQGLRKLRWLSLPGCGITDTGLQNIGKLVRLEYLDLSRTKVTDRGLVHLRGLKGLRLLDVSGTTVTEQGIERIQRALPNCKVEFGEPD